MTLLTAYTDADAPEKVLESEEAEEITVTLKEIDVNFERWEVAEEFAAGGDQQAILDRYRDDIARVVEAEGYVLVDVTQLHRTDDPGWEELKTAARTKFLSEHTHDDDEVRFFVSGSGIFYLHVGQGLRRPLRGGGHAQRAEEHHALVRHGDRARLHRRPLLPRRGRLGRQLHREPARRAHPELRPDRRGPGEPARLTRRGRSKGRMHRARARDHAPGLVERGPSRRSHACPDPLGGMIVTSAPGSPIGGYELLDAQSAIGYVAARPELAAQLDVSAVDVRELSDGNLNLVFLLRDGLAAGSCSSSRSRTSGSTRGGR